MKRYLLLLFILFGLNSFCQEESNLNVPISIEISGIYPLYILDNFDLGDFREISNGFNYGIGLNLIKTTKHFNIRLGTYFSTKNLSISYEKDIFSELREEKRKLKYFNIPIVIDIFYFKSENWRFSFISGLLINRVFNYKKVLIYKNGNQEEINNILIDYQCGKIIRMGIGVTLKLNGKFNLNINPCMDYKVGLDYIKSHPRSQFENLTNDRLSFVFNIGLEYKLYSRE